MMHTILVIDDEPTIRESLVYALERDGFNTRQAGCLREARELLASASFLILDLMLPDGNGIDFLKQIRMNSKIPVIVLTSRDDEIDRVVGLEVGADDYVTKPFSPREVAARVKAVLRRVEHRNDEGNERERALLGHGDLSLNPTTRRVLLGGRDVGLSKTEFDLLAVLLRSPGRVFERSLLLELVWGADGFIGDRTVDVHLKSLRKKIKQAGGDPGIIETVRGVGYRLRENR